MLAASELRFEISDTVTRMVAESRIFMIYWTIRY
jgi:hypothetical protein